MKQYWILKGVKFLFFAVLFIFLFGWVTMTAWNYVMPAVFSLPIVNYWQALAMLILAKVLFWHGGGGWRKGHHYGGGNPYFKKMMEKRMENMTPEQREKIKGYWERKCGFTHDVSEEKNENINS